MKDLLKHCHYHLVFVKGFKVALAAFEAPGVDSREIKAEASMKYQKDVEGYESLEEGVRRMLLGR